MTRRAVTEGAVICNFIYLNMHAYIYKYIYIDPRLGGYEIYKITNMLLADYAVTVLINKYINTCIDAYILHTCIHTYIHTYIHACIHTYIHTYVISIIDPPSGGSMRVA